MRLNISAFNVKGLRDNYKRETLLNDSIKKKQDRRSDYTRNTPEGYRASNMSSKG